MCCLSNPPFWLVVVVFASIKIQKLFVKKFALKLNQVAYLIQILTFPLSNSISHSNVLVLRLLFLLIFFLLFRQHQVFSTWPEDVIKNVAVESKLRDYNSDEVIVRDSSDLHWIVFIVKVS